MSYFAQTGSPERKIFRLASKSAAPSSDFRDRPDPLGRTQLLRHDMTSRSMAIVLLAAAAQGCALKEPSPLPGAEAYRTSVASALNYYEGSEKRYLISTPHQGLPGHLTVCTREEIVDGRGNKIEAGPMIIYEIDRDRIMDSRENDMCLSRDYGPLQPVKR